MNGLNKSKKLTLILLSVVAILSFSTGLMTIAMLRSETGKLTNKFELGNVTTEIEEEFEKTQIVTTFKKEPIIRNTGKSDCYVRVRVTISPEEAIVVVGDEEAFGGTKTNWVYYNGYYYYKTPIVPGEATTPLFNTVTVKDEYIDTIEGFEVTVYQEAVQAKLSAKDGSYTTSSAEIWAVYDKGIIPESFN